jgi:predicted dehydrogenase
MRAAFVGFRHMHIFEVYAKVAARQDMEIVALCEEDPETVEHLVSERGIQPTHSSFESMLAEARFDLLVVGDVFSKRGARICDALRAGKHVLSDKPICTDLKELREIEALSGGQSPALAAVLELRDSGAFRRTRELVQAGTIGRVHAICFSGQHPMLPGSRPRWYFEPGKHGGTINDLAIHAVDILPWITGAKFAEIAAARCWSSAPPGRPGFQNAAQLMLVMEGGCGVIGDVSYISPDRFGYTLPQYWRFNLWGEGGMLETAFNESKILLYPSEAELPREIEAAANRPGGYLEDLLQSVRGKRERPNRELIEATRICLKTQEAADRRPAGIPL